jgi:peroxiredoxin
MNAPRNLWIASCLTAGTLGGLCAPAGGAEAAELRLGDKAPNAGIKMKNVDGKELSITSAAGEKGTLVIFTCNHCPWAKAWESRIVELGNTFSKQGLGVIAINPNDPSAYDVDRIEVMKERAKKTGMAFPYVVDATSDVARAFGATKTPEAYLFDRSGKLVYHGAIDDNANEPDKVSKRFLKDAIEAMIQGRSVAVAETKALGCSIKFRNRS